MGEIALTSTSSRSVNSGIAGPRSLQTTIFRRPAAWVVRERVWGGRALQGALEALHMPVEWNATRWARWAWGRERGTDFVKAGSLISGSASGTATYCISTLKLEPLERGVLIYVRGIQQRLGEGEIEIRHRNVHGSIFFTVKSVETRERLGVSHFFKFIAPLT